MASAPITERGRATRRRIVTAAAALIGERGVLGTSLDDIRAGTKSSKSPGARRSAARSRGFATTAYWRRMRTSRR